MQRRHVALASHHAHARVWGGGVGWGVGRLWKHHHVWRTQHVVCSSHDNNYFAKQRICQYLVPGVSNISRAYTYTHCTRPVIQKLVILKQSDNVLLRTTCPSNSLLIDALYHQSSASRTASGCCFVTPGIAAVFEWEEWTSGNMTTR